MDLPKHAGIGLKPQHYADVLSGDSPSGRPNWVEVHPQNYFGVSDNWGGGPPHRWLSEIAQVCPISFHSVGLSLGSAEGVNQYDLDKLVELCARYQPSMVSDHLSFSGDAHNRYADLLPVPYTHDCLEHFAATIGTVQDRLGREILVENPSRMLGFAGDEMNEVEFFAALIKRTGCGLLFDINNVVVSATNLGFSAQDYVDTIDPDWIGEIHLAGHAVEHHDSGPLLIDDHGSIVGEETWALYRRFLARSGAKPTLIEWDTAVPDYAMLMCEANTAEAFIKEAQYALA
jgi:uncharacterized protein (UPF0276 family)